MPDAPAVGRWDLAAAGSAALLLFLAYVVWPRPVVQYAAWLAVFCLWMAWFVFFGTRWLYGAEG